MFSIRFSTLFSLLTLTICALARGQTAPSQTAAPASAADATPSTQPDIHKTDLLDPPFTSSVHGIQFRPPLHSVKIDRNAPDSIVEFDQNDYNWQLKAWSTILKSSLALSTHKDQFGMVQDGVMEITLTNIKSQTPDVQILRNEIITVGRVRVGIFAVRYETADHERRFTQQAIIEAPDADDKLYYFIDLTGPGKPKLEPDDIVNPAEKAAFDTFGEVVDSIVLLDRTNVVDMQRKSLFGSMGLFVLWGADNFKMVKTAIQPEQFRRIIRNGQDIGYMHIVEEFQPNGKAPEASTLRIGIRSWMSPTPLQIWNTETWMYSSADRKHEHWKTAAQAADNHGKQLDSFSQVGMSDEQTKAFAIEPQQAPDGSLLPAQDHNANHMGPLGQGNVDIETRRSLEVTTTHQRAQLNPFHLDTPPFYVPQAYSFLLPEILPLKPKTYMFAVFVPNTPENSSAASAGNVLARYIEVLPIQHITFHGQEFDAIPVTDKITLDGTVTTIYRSLDGKFMGSTTILTDGDKTTTMDILPTDSQTLGHIWNRPDLASPNAPADTGDQILPTPPPAQ